MTHRRAYLCCLLTFALVLCGVSMIGGCMSPDADYVAADKANFEDVGEDYLRYVEADQTLTEEQRQAKRDSVALWRMRIQAGDPADPDPFSP